MEFIVQKSNIRLDHFLVTQLSTFSRTELQRFIKKGIVYVNSVSASKSRLLLKIGDRVSLDERQLVIPSKDFTLAPDPSIPLHIIYEDNDLLVLVKPAGILVHPTASSPGHTLANALIARYPQLVGVGENSLRPGILHRLDRNTSGLLVVAKNQTAFQFLKAQFHDRQVVKKYLALVEGFPEKTEGIIEYPIRPSTQNRLKKVAILRPTPEILAKKSTRAASTSYSIKKTFNENCTLLEVVPKTGRTHQIRVHLAAIGHPIIGDLFYGAKKSPLHRQFLHAFFLQFKKIDDTIMTFEAPLTEELEKFLKRFTPSNQNPSQ